MGTSRLPDGVTLAAIERAAVNGWPALETIGIDGWLARWSSGGSVRANTVSALDYTGGDLERSLAQVVAFYETRSVTAGFTITEVAAPTELDRALAERGWRRGGEHATMAKAAGAGASAAGEGCRTGSASGIAVVRHEQPTEAWFRVYIEGLSGDRRMIAPRLVAGVPAARMFFSGYRDGAVVASGLSVIEGSLASVQCMATRPDARRSGAAQAVLADIERWAVERRARCLYLQTETGNVPATTLYARVGFAVVGHYHVRTLGGGS